MVRVCIDHHITVRQGLYICVTFFSTQLEELKPGGKNIAVTANNRIEYIHLMADYKINKQVHVMGSVQDKYSDPDHTDDNTKYSIDMLSY